MSLSEYIASLDGVGSQEQQPVCYPEWPGEPQHGPDESTLKIAVRFELLPL